MVLIIDIANLKLISDHYSLIYDNSDFIII